MEVMHLLQVKLNLFPFRVPALPCLWEQISPFPSFSFYFTFPFFFSLPFLLSLSLALISLSFSRFFHSPPYLFLLPFPFTFPFPHPFSFSFPPFLSFCLPFLLPSTSPSPSLLFFPLFPIREPFLSPFFLLSLPVASVTRLAPRYPPSSW